MDHRTREISTHLQDLQLINIVSKYDYYFHGTPHPQLQLKGITHAAIVLLNGDIAFGCNNNIYIYNTKIIAILSGHTDVISCLGLLSNGDIVSGSVDNTLRLWNATTFICYDVLIHHSDTINDILILPDDRIVTASSDTEIVIWESSQQFTILSNYRSSVERLAMLDNGNRIISGSDSDYTRIWDIHTGKAQFAVGSGNAGTTALLVLQKEILCGYDDGYITAYSSKRDKFLYHLRKSINHSIQCLFLISEGIIASGSSGGIVEIWNLKKRKVIHTFNLGSDAIKCIIKLPDGNIVIGTESPIIYVCNPYTGQLIYTLKDAYSSTVLLFSNNKVVNVMENGTITIWE